MKILKTMQHIGTEGRPIWLLMSPLYTLLMVLKCGKKIGLPPLLPPKVKKQPGKPKKLRMREKNEPQNPHKLKRKHTTTTCSTCGKLGHNRRSCKGQPMVCKSRRETMPASMNTDSNTADATPISSPVVMGSQQSAN
ncbi:uncharacterized protein LOC114308113 [Camellia sinensis]|uniref:uncharacterized protein LOC114308113 n=1 Tax=Camellia sinensis TaxID=4442 RepID=UPI0010365634|nr:uncharacterized protein LOC114308113 [Camellia sinensis]